MPLVSGPSYSGNDIASNTWILRRSLESSICASPFQKRRWFLWSCIEEDTSNSDTINISDFNTWLSCGWYESGNTETEYDLACLSGLNRISQVIVSWLKDNVETLIKLGIDILSRVFFVGDKNFWKINLFRILEVVCGTNLVVLNSWNIQGPPSIVFTDVWLFSNNWWCSYVCVWFASMISTMSCRSVRASRKHHVPVSTVPSTAKMGVSSHPLLLTSWINGTSNIHVGHVAPTRPSTLTKGQVTIDLHPSDRWGLWHRPCDFRVELKVLCWSPKVTKSTVMRIRATIWTH